MVRKAIEEINLSEKVEIESFSGLLVEFSREKGACVIIRGLRAVSDFEYEMQLALMNRKLSNSIDTIFLMPSLRYIFLSSSIIKEAARFGGKVDDLVPRVVAEKLAEKFSRKDIL
jgi:pantetheine-phosphate adenylyltransferase